MSTGSPWLVLFFGIFKALATTRVFFSGNKRPTKEPVDLPFCAAVKNISRARSRSANVERGARLEVPGVPGCFFPRQERETSRPTGFNGRAVQYAPTETTNSRFLLAFSPPPSTSQLLSSIVSSSSASHPPLSRSSSSRAYLVYSFNTSLSNRLLPLLQLRYRAAALSRSPRSPGTSHSVNARCFGNRSSRDSIRNTRDGIKPGTTSISRDFPIVEHVSWTKRSNVEAGLISEFYSKLIDDVLIYEKKMWLCLYRRLE